MLTYKPYPNIVYSSRLLGSVPNSSDCMAHNPQVVSTHQTHPLASPGQTLTDITPSGYHITTHPPHIQHIQAHAHNLTRLLTNSETKSEYTNVIPSHLNKPNHHTIFHAYHTHMIKHIQPSLITIRHPSAQRPPDHHGTR